ncbi:MULTISPECIES: GxxExxY protein [unclassified Methylophaga]|jgi:GxxExxY protein|uniref:GxxExxY protein n=1 Tax=unclassified Methylophaga TaxID=2629249 RepID=UPI000C925BA3|nr:MULTISPECIES: GxxExxY protein [unclassified Methylophaga]MAK67939.1 GxxExxY protein [Methylophaga sp.]MAY16714.1 GxxExxY protein [Methylophaga sp.]HAO23942.1 GxxExxY protein [Methylophaga sp.]|tara:strand:- start:1957 stop:2328 length:372 start_codon:yes stop_codon:yes gene_type:complete
MSNELTGEIIGAAIEVHRQVGPGLLEAIYEECLISELKQRGLRLLNQYPLPIFYKGRQLNSAYRLDLLVEDKVIVELKTVESLTGLHKAQLLTYLKLAKLRYGLLLNFNVSMMRQGIVRMLND